MNKLYIPIILGTAREGRYTEAIAHHVFSFMQTLDIETELFDVKDYPQTRTEDPNVDMKRWGDAAARADGFLIVSPEYNHGYPGELKMFFDSAYRQYKYKPIAFCAVSSGVIGGARSVEQLILVSIAAQMIPIKQAVYFAEVAKILNEDGTLKDSETWNKRLAVTAQELIWFAGALRQARLDRLAD